jgi:hypothetical protein
MLSARRSRRGGVRRALPATADVDNTDKLTRDRLTSTFRELRRR